MDKLAVLFEEQKKFMEHLKIYYPVDLHTFEGQNKIREIVFWMVNEAFEMCEWMQYKPWRKNPPEFNENKFKEEVADILHFFLELCIMCDIDDEYLFELYNKKLEKNYKRQEEDY